MIKIYSIHHVSDPHSRYVGSTKSDRRFAQHLRRLKRGAGSKFLQAAWDLCPNIDDWKFEILETCSVEDRASRERFWIDRFGTLNDIKDANGPGTGVSPEFIRRGLEVSHTNNRTPEGRARVSEHFRNYYSDPTVRENASARRTRDNLAGLTGNATWTEASRVSVSNKGQARVRKNARKYRGVRKLNSGRFTVSIKFRSKTIRLGVYDTEIEAAKVYNEKARELYGPGAFQNTL